MFGLTVSLPYPARLPSCRIFRRSGYAAPAKLQGLHHKGYLVVQVRSRFPPLPMLQGHVVAAACMPSCQLYKDMLRLQVKWPSPMLQRTCWLQQIKPPCQVTRTHNGGAGFQKLSYIPMRGTQCEHSSSTHMLQGLVLVFSSECCRALVKRSLR